MQPSRSAKIRTALAITLIGVLLAWFFQRNPTSSSPAAHKATPDERAAAAPATAFDFYLLALTVHPAFCADGHALLPECRAGGRRALVIHGLWPERNAPRTYPRDCPAAPLELDPALALELADFMPGVAENLHQHEWRAHGGCSRLDDDAYFRSALQLARTADAALSAKLTTLAGRETSVDELRATADAFHPGLGRTLTFHCRALRDARSQQPHLIEVRQCVDNDGPDGAPGTMLDCGAVERRDQGCGRRFLIAATRR